MVVVLRVERPNRGTEKYGDRRVVGVGIEGPGARNGKLEEVVGEQKSRDAAAKNFSGVQVAATSGWYTFRMR